MKTKKIILLGYMGSGKTSVGNLLKKKINYPFSDLDKFIENKNKLSITTIFKKKGELFFRNAEKSALEELMNTDGPMIISLGGGTPCYHNIMEYLNSLDQVKTFYLKTDVVTLSKRLKSEKKTRPLISHIKNSKEIEEFVGKHLFERNVFYSKADFKINTEKKSVEEITYEIQNHLT